MTVPFHPIMKMISSLKFCHGNSTVQCPMTIESINQKDEIQFWPHTFRPSSNNNGLGNEIDNNRS